MLSFLKGFGHRWDRLGPLFDQRIKFVRYLQSALRYAVIANLPQPKISSVTFISKKKDSGFDQIRQKRHRLSWLILRVWSGSDAKLYETTKYLSSLGGRSEIESQTPVINQPDQTRAHSAVTSINLRKTHHFLWLRQISHLVSLIQLKYDKLANLSNKKRHLKWLKMNK